MSTFGSAGVSVQLVWLGKDYYSHWEDYST